MRRRRARLRAAAALLTAGLGLSACATIGITDVPEAPEGMIDVLRLPAEATGAVQGLINYNWLSTNPITSTWLYEPLMIRDEFTCEAIGWLATGYEWESPTRLRIDLREGVQWTDGEDFTSEDVAFNFLMAKEYPAADRGGLWSDLFGAPAESVETPDEHTVIVTFTGSAVAKTDKILNEIKIVPEHVWADVGDPTQYVDTDPVSTGPFVHESYNGRQLTLERNESYWNAENVKVERLILEGQYDANSGALAMRNGALDLYTGDIPNPERSVSRSGVEYYYPPGGTTVLAMNMTRPVTGDLAFRQATAYAIDKEALALRASFGIMDVGSQTMLKLPIQQDQVPEQWRGEEFIPHDPATANQILDEAGYAMGEDGWRTAPDGSPIALVFSVQAGWMDYIAMADVVVRSLQAVGIDAKVVTTDPNAVDSMKKSGEYDMVLDSIGGGCQRSRDLGGRLTTSQIPDGDTILLNIARYDDPEVDQLVEDWSASTDPAQEAGYLSEIVDVYMEQMPYIALQYSPVRLIYREDNAVGWPSEDDPYPTNNMLRVITTLRPPEDAA
ncbi:ABC transporter substrate-binding protein [Pseudactinotalea suaedae]|uniref:ABC transporter substrate-binding protein n=1 Tax=Pseudactinotalea suaedae TaxID=1524924 RepID=UPI0012E18561|nr:ABC transporter substrate-binding protein [Pseudactinotalea suaedae]